MKQDEKEVQRLLEVIRTLMRMLGFTNREVERRLGLHPSSLTRFFNGQVEAKLELVLSIARAIGLEYGELFAFAYPGIGELEESEAGLKVRSLLEGLKPPRSRQPTAADQPVLEQLVQQLLKRLQVPGADGD